LNSLDDPISHFQSIPFDVSKLNKNIVLAVTEKGGHLGFSEGIFPFFNTSWSERVSIHFLKSVQNKNIDF
jgi:predicted alpha/beta-fold hydrolase